MHIMKKFQPVFCLGLTAGLGVALLFAIAFGEQKNQEGPDASEEYYSLFLAARKDIKALQKSCGGACDDVLLTHTNQMCTLKASICLAE